MGKKKDFEKRIQILKDYYARYGHLNIKQNEVFNNVKIGQLVSNLRKERREGTLTYEQIEILTLWGFKWRGEKSFEEKAEELKLWYRKYGTLTNLTQYSKLEVGGKTIDIGETVRRLRLDNRNDKLTYIQKAFLKSIGFPFAKIDEIYADVIDYRKKYGTLKGIKKSQIYEYEGKQYDIGKQILHVIERFRNGKLTEEEYEFFNELGMFDKWKANKLKLWYKGKLSPVDYERFRLKEVDKPISKNK